MAGRTAPPGQNAAELRYRAFQQRLQMLQMRTSNTAKLSSSFPVPFGPPTPPPAWSNPGPTNLASDTTGSQSYGAVTGRATSVAIDQGDTTGNTVYIGGAFGGVWKSTNATAAPGSVTWTSLIDGQITDAVGAIAVQPGTTGSTAVVMVGLGEPNSSADSYYGQGLLRSTNGGGSWTLITADSLGNTFQGLGFSKIAYSTKNTSLAVAATASTDFGFTETAVQGNAITRGPYFSTNGGATWTVACVTDGTSACARGTNSIFPGSTTEVVFNPSQGTNGTFYALIRAHGMYQSTDGGANWTRLANQPQGTTLMNTTNCPSNTSNLTTCPLYRGHIAVRVIDSTHSEMYVSYVDVNENIAGVFRSLDGGGTWPTNLGTTGYISCGDAFGCGTSQSTYNMYLNAIAGATTATDLYLGGINIFRCHLASTSATTCSWTNLTHAYGCNPTAAPSNVHPDQHGMDFLASNANIMYFANDGGIYSTQDGAAVDGTCTATNATHWRNLNVTLGPMTEYVSFSQDITNPAIYMGGTQDNGSSASDGSGNWIDVNNGDGGFNAIDPTNPNIWYTSNTDVSVQRCAKTPATSCRFADFPLIVDDIPVSQGGNNNIPDAGSFYTPFILDPLDPTKVIIATCRVWRGSSSNPAAWPGTNNANALSFNLDTGTATACTSNDTMISALAAGGPAAPSGSAAVIYAGREDGEIFVSTAAESGASSFANRSISAATTGCPGSGASASGGCKISSIAVDVEDTTGQTAVATVMGFGVGHVWRTNNAGMTWTNIDNGGLPDSPANSAIVDPFDSTHIFVGNDVGVFETLNQGSTWAEVGTGFPAVPATRLLLFDGNGTRHLRVSTYGRGIWDVQMAAVGAFFSFQAPSGISQTIAAGQNATYNLSITSNNSFAGSVTFTCAGAPGGSTCTVNNGNPLTLSAGQTQAFTVTVTNTQNAGVAPSGLRGWPMAFAAILAGLLIGATRKPKQAFPMALAVLLVGGMLSCGGGGGGGGGTPTPTPTPIPTPTPKPNTNATLVVTGTAGSVNRSISLNLTVTH
jgi:hypothetical protein